jgi:hypothetical protein
MKLILIYLKRIILVKAKIKTISELKDVKEKYYQK